MWSASMWHTHVMAPFADSLKAYLAWMANHCAANLPVPWHGVGELVPWGKDCYEIRTLNWRKARLLWKRRGRMIVSIHTEILWGHCLAQMHIPCAKSNGRCFFMLLMYRPSKIFYSFAAIAQFQTTLPVFICAVIVRAAPSWLGWTSSATTHDRLLIHPTSQEHSRFVAMYRYTVQRKSSDSCITCLGKKTTAQPTRGASSHATTCYYIQPVPCMQEFGLEVRLTPTPVHSVIHLWLVNSLQATLEGVTLIVYYSLFHVIVYVKHPRK